MDRTSNENIKRQQLQKKRRWYLVITEGVLGRLSDQGKPRQTQEHRHSSTHDKQTINNKIQQLTKRRKQTFCQCRPQWTGVT